MYHEKDNDHRSGGNGKKELGSGRCRGRHGARWMKKVEVRAEST